MTAICSPTLIIGVYLLLSFTKTCFAADTLTLSQSLSDGMTMDSENGTFQLGFFTPLKSSNRYLGIWYKNLPLQTVIWVANREKAIRNFSVSLQINISNGKVLLVSNNNNVLWSAVPCRTTENPVLQLLDTGNLVLREHNDSNPRSYLWQSFDHPSDTVLPSMKFGKDFRTGIDRRLTAWKSQDDASPGNFNVGFDNLGSHINNPETVMWLGRNIHYRTGPWNGLQFSGTPFKWSNQIQEIFIDNQNESCFYYNLAKPLLMRGTLNETTLALESYVWSEAENTWTLLVTVPRDYCDIYGQCGPNGICDFYNSPAACQCLNGFKPKSPENWNTMKYSEGCVRETPLTCQNDEFLKYQGFKLPDTTFSWLDRNMNLKECKEKCMSNCSCMAYANSDIRGGGSGCTIWFGDLIDIKVQPGDRQILYLRRPTPISERRSAAVKKVAAIVVGISVICGLLIVGCGISRSRMKCRGQVTENNMEPKNENEGNQNDLDLPLFELSKIVTATGNFSLNNKVGEGGFGTVFQGTLENGQQIAVKRLSRSSRQGVDELKNEVNLIAKLQHRNLVQLVGCCMQDEEKLLIYEFMPNKSLDLFLFDEAKRKMLDWSKRFQIICGIARGLLYLHQDSRLRIIHRDLKASNILLDSEMNPKISDFGLARSFGGEGSSRNTNRVAGTHGYMAPEYAIHGHFSVKSDVFSYGVLVLEIVTGQKSRGLYSRTNGLNLIAYAWDLWKEGRFSELVDEDIVGERCNMSEALLCIHIGLLCLQENPEDRPTISSVLLTLDCKSSLPQPKEPAFLLGEHADDGNISSYNSPSINSNGLTVTILEPR